MEKKSGRSELVNWTVTLAVMAVLWVTGLHKPIISGLQKAVLATGIIQPDIDDQSGLKKSVDLNIALSDEQGNVMNMSKFKGKVLFINFWATWCPPCRAEMPGIQNLYEKMGSEKMEFVMISSDRNFQSAIDFKKENGFTFPIYQLKGTLPIELESQILPTTYVVNANGNIVMTETGMAQYDSEKFVTFIKGLLEN